MKRLIWTYLLIIVSVVMSAQTQQGYVKTKGRLGNNGKVIAGSRISGATVQVKGRTAVVSKSNGTFSFHIPAQNYYLQSVQKQGYNLTDIDILSRQHSYSKNPLVLVMEDKAQQETERKAIERKVSNNLYSQLQNRQDEIDALKEQNKISDEKYRELLQQLNKYQDDNEQIIKSMVERYSKIDFDMVDEFNRRISDCILNGRLTEADSLINSKGDLTVRTTELRRHQEANAQEETELVKRTKKLEKSKEYARQKIEELALDCYSKYEIYKIQHRNDSADYYLELRATLDTTNVEWTTEAGEFAEFYMSDYPKALNYYLRLLRQCVIQFGNFDDWTAIAYNNIGGIYSKQGQYSKALEYYAKALNISEQAPDIELPNLAKIYNNIGAIYARLGDNDKALHYFDKGLNLWKKTYGEEHQLVATSYNNIGRIYCGLADYPKGLEYFEKALAIREKVLGPEHPSVALSYNNIGAAYASLSDPIKALEYHTKALELRKNVFGENHPTIAESYNNIASVYAGQGNHSIALEYFTKALVIREKVLDPNHPDIAVLYNNIGTTYISIGDISQGLENLMKALKIMEKKLGTEHPTIASAYGNIAFVYSKMGDYSKALEYYNKTLSIFENKFGSEHPNTKKVKTRIDEVKQKIIEHQVTQ